MKTIIRTVFIMALFSFQTANANRESGGFIEASAVFVNLMSFGSGIDSRTLNVVEKFLESSTVQRNILDFVRMQKGMEGETMICAKFTDSSFRSAFITAIAPTILSDRSATLHKRTSVRVGEDCADYNSATEQDLSAYVTKSSSSIFGQHDAENSLPKPIMNCFEADHGLTVKVSRDQFGVFSAKLTNISLVGESELAVFQHVGVKIYKDTLIPTEAYGSVDLDSGNMFHLGITDPSSGEGRFFGNIRAVIDGELYAAEVHCRKVK